MATKEFCGAEVQINISKLQSRNHLIMTEAFEYSGPSYPQFCCGFSYLQSTLVKKQMILLMYHQKIIHQQSNTTSQCLCHSTHFISSHRYHHKEKGKYSIKYFEKENTHINFISYIIIIVLFIIVVNLLLCLIHKLNFIRGMHVCVRKSIVFIGFGNICSFKHPLGVLEHIPCG